MKEHEYHRLFKENVVVLPDKQLNTLPMTSGKNPNCTPDYTGLPPERQSNYVKGTYKFWWMMLAKSPL